MRARLLLVSCSIAIVLTTSRVTGQDSLAAARQLYASAEYGSALTMLSALLAANPAPQERQTIELYRVFCLFAVNDLEQANSALEAMILRDPLYRPNVDEVPRRLRAVFSDTRKRLLPSIVEEKYLVAKAAFDRGDFEAAATGFTQALSALDDPDIAAEAERHPLSDLRVLATGFKELTMKAMEPAPAPPAAPAAPPAPVAAAAPPAARVPAIYEGGSANVTPPIVVRQDMPPSPRQLTARRNGLIEVVIDESGLVESATMVSPVHPWYNPLVLAAAKLWRYRPATLDGVPVKFRKRIQIVLSPDQ